MFNQHCKLIFMFRPITELARHSSLDARSFPPSFTSSLLSLLANLWGPLVSPILFLSWAIRTQGQVPARCATSSLLDKPLAPYDLPFSLCLSPCAPVAPLPCASRCSRSLPLLLAAPTQHRRRPRASTVALLPRVTPLLVPFSRAPPPLSPHLAPLQRSSTSCAPVAVPSPTAVLPLPLRALPFLLLPCLCPGCPCRAPSPAQLEYHPPPPCFPQPLCAPHPCCCCSCASPSSCCRHRPEQDEQNRR
jgi:hypothetical protein